MEKLIKISGSSALMLVANFYGCQNKAVDRKKETEKSIEHPNIVWITTEDLSPRLSMYGDSLAKTPHLDSLAKQGVVFNNCYATSPVCAPARSAIITGMYPTQPPSVPCICVQ